jgi:hypothetical protein
MPLQCSVPCRCSAARRPLRRMLARARAGARRGVRGLADAAKAPAAAGGKGGKGAAAAAGGKGAAGAAGGKGGKEAAAPAPPAKKKAPPPPRPAWMDQPIPDKLFPWQKGHKSPNDGMDYLVPDVLGKGGAVGDYDDGEEDGFYRGPFTKRQLELEKKYLAEMGLACVVGKVKEVLLTHDDIVVATLERYGPRAGEMKIICSGKTSVFVKPGNVLSVVGYDNKGLPSGTQLSSRKVELKPADYVFKDGDDVIKGKDGAPYF